MHDGHCAAGWLSDKSICVASLEACAAHCNDNKECGYFAYTKSCDGNTNCAVYDVASGCPDDNNFPKYNAYRLSRQTSDGMHSCMYGMMRMHVYAMYAMHVCMFLCIYIYPPLITQPPLVTQAYVVWVWLSGWLGGWVGRWVDWQRMLAKRS